MEHHLWLHLRRLLNTTTDIEGVVALTSCIFFSASFKSYLQLKIKILQIQAYKPLPCSWVYNHLGNHAANIYRRAPTTFHKSPDSWDIILYYIISYYMTTCGLVVTVPGYRARCPGFDSGQYQIFWEIVGLERGPLSLVSINEELPEWRSNGSGSRKSKLTAVWIRCAEYATPSS
jgi:hypothetical protein